MKYLLPVMLFVFSLNAHAALLPKEIQGISEWEETSSMTVFGHKRTYYISPTGQKGCAILQYTPGISDYIVAVFYVYLQGEWVKVYDMSDTLKEISRVKGGDI